MGGPDKAAEAEDVKYIYIKAIGEEKFTTEFLILPFCQNEIVFCVFLVICLCFSLLLKSFR